MDSTNPVRTDKGKAGYAGKRTNDVTGNITIKYAYSSWTDKTPPPPPPSTIRANYLAWNTVAGSTITPGTTGAWTGGSTWSRDNPTALIPWPTTGANNALFTGTTGNTGPTITVPSAVTVDTMRFSSRGYTIGSGTAPGTITLSNGVYVDSATITATINAGIGGAALLTKRGAGELVLGGAGRNTYSGGTTINGGRITASKDTALGTGNVTVSAGATLNLGGGVTLPNTISLGGTGSTLISGGNTGNNAVGGLTFGTAAGTVTANSPLHVSGVMGGTATMTKNGSAALIILGAGTYSGTATISAGSLQIGNGAGTGSLAGGNVALSGAGTSIAFSRTGDVAHTGNITGTGTLTKSGSGTLTLGGNNTYTGTTTISGGKVIVSSATNIGSGTITVAPACSLVLSTAATTTVAFGRNLDGGGTFIKTGSGAFSFGTVKSQEIARVHVDGGTLEIPGGSLTTDALKVKVLRLASGSGIDLAVDNRNRTTRITVDAGAADIGSGVLNITSLSTSDVGQYNIISGVPSSNTKGFYDVTSNASCCQVRQEVVELDGIGRTVRINVTADTSRVRNYLKVDSAVAGATEGSVTVYLSGLSDLREFLLTTANPRVSAVNILYMPGRAARSVDEATSTEGGGTYPIPISGLPAAGNTHQVTFNVSPPVKDNIYGFNVGLTWVVGTATQARTPETNADYCGEAYLLDPKSAVKENKLSIVENEGARYNQSDGLRFSLTISGLSNGDFTPSDRFASYRPRVDSVGVWFKRGGALPSDETVTGPGLRVGGYGELITFRLYPDSGNTRQISFSTGRVENPTETFHFAVAPHWVLAGKVDSVARKLATTTVTVPQPDRKDLPNNTCLLTAEQPDKRATVVNLKISKSGALNEFAKDILVQLAFDAMMTDVIDSFRLVPSDLNARDIDKVLKPNDLLAGAEREVHYKITVYDATGYGVDKTGSFMVGRRDPAPLSGFTAEAMGGGAMLLSWSPVTGLDTATLARSKIYIVYSTGPLTLAPEDVMRFSRIDTVAAGETSKEISRLDTGTDYWFYAVVYDVANPSKPAMNVLSPVAVCNGNTGTATRLTNLARVARFEFSDSGENFSFAFELTKNLESDERQLSYTYYIMRGADTVLTPKTNKFAAHDAVMRDSIFAEFTTEKLGNALVFGTTYTLYIFTSNAAGGSSARDQKSVTLSSFGRQTILIQIGDSGSVNSGAFKLSAAGWKNSTGVCTTTVYSSDKNISTNGFVPIGDHGYRYEVAIAGGLNATHGAFTIGMAVDEGSIPSQYTVDNVRMYRWTETNRYWEVVYGSRYERGYITGTAVDSIFKSGENGSTYRLMISETFPTVATLTDATSPIAASDPIKGSFRVSTVVGNAKIEVMYALAEGATRLDTVKRSDDTTGGLYKNVTFEISENVVYNAMECGVLVYVVVNDGHHTIHHNVSRRVRSDSYRGFQVKPLTRKWLPFASQVELNTAAGRSVRNALSVYFEGEDEGSFEIYDTLFRLFRWYETSDNRSDNSKWVEYKPGNDEVFAMEPGRLMWFKTSNFRSLNFGEATTVSLTSPFIITLPPKQWTDLVLPFRFKVCLGDILDSTAATDSLEFYRWEDPNGKQYSTKALKLMVADSSLELNGAEDPFTIYNSGNAAITLRIPPTPAFLSRYNKANAQKKGMAKAAAAQEASDVWYYALRTRTSSAPELPEVQIGYNAYERAFAVPPSFGSEAVVIIDDATGKEMGHHYSPALASGRTYRLRFYNDDKRKSTFTFSAHPSANAPTSAQITYVRAATGDIIGNRSSASSSITVAGMSYEDVLMIIGGNGYRTKAVAATPAGAKFWVNNIAVNRGAGSARINYYVPAAGVDRVDVSIYDMKGRLVWKNSQKAKAAAINTMEWNSRASGRGGASARMYIVRVKAVGVNGKAVAVENKRITFVR